MREYRADAIWVDNLADQMAVGFTLITGLVTILVNNFSHFAVSVVTEGLSLAAGLSNLYQAVGIVPEIPGGTPKQGEIGQAVFMSCIGILGKEIKAVSVVDGAEH
ncbi:hypothetical protein NFHSH190041_19360 [Shewanella sp. NFH-SH190041]|uniref:hypothetical protein n=1 Tax=Shewanella sp. NFH-SH190041 TaxID=2950245 RepID=UPI0021C3944F|nr:hypothetical protein [Shewanella sp. NFH-SH190041]BDM64484.1 hypothetical protein NFHSH190041_19360 [Shewanella sp. NFH-SH190041]